MVVKCVKDFSCEVCNIPGMLQILTTNYARVRHYVRLVNGKPVFEYHRNSIEYVNRILANFKTNPDQKQNTDHNKHDLKLNSLGSNIENKWAGSLARLGHPLDVRKVTGSNPVRPTKTNKNVGMNLESAK